MGPAQGSPRAQGPPPSLPKESRARCPRPCRNTQGTNPVEPPGSVRTQVRQGARGQSQPKRWRENLPKGKPLCVNPKVSGQHSRLRLRVQGSEQGMGRPGTALPEPEETQVQPRVSNPTRATRFSRMFRQYVLPCQGQKNFQGNHTCGSCFPGTNLQASIRQLTKESGPENAKGNTGACSNVWPGLLPNQAILLEHRRPPVQACRRPL